LNLRNIKNESNVFEWLLQLLAGPIKLLYCCN
jgi:hypothetical protein